MDDRSGRRSRWEAHKAFPALIGSASVRVLKRVALPKHIPSRLRGAAMALLGIPGPPRGGEEDHLLILTTAEAESDG